MRQNVLPFGHISKKIDRATVTFWRDNELIDIPIDGDGWQDWLARGQSFRMNVGTPTGLITFNVIAEKHKGVQGYYWRAHKTIKKRTHRKYLGPSSKLTRAKLAEAGAHFAKLMPGPEPEPPMDWGKLSDDQRGRANRYIQTLLAKQLEFGNDEDYQTREDRENDDE